jgi:hypothetical protein
MLQVSFYYYLLLILGQDLFALLQSNKVNFFLN